MKMLNKTLIIFLLLQTILTGCIYGTNTVCSTHQEGIDRGMRACKPDNRCTIDPENTSAPYCGGKRPSDSATK